MNINTTIRAGKTTLVLEVRPGEEDDAHIVSIDVRERAWTSDNVEDRPVLQLSGKVTHAVVRHALDLLLARVGGGAR